MDEDEKAGWRVGSQKMSDGLFFLSLNTHLQAISYFSNSNKAWLLAS